MFQTITKQQVLGTFEGGENMMGPLSHWKSLLLLILWNDEHLVNRNSGFGVSGLWALGTLLLELRYYFKMLNIDGALYLAVEKVSPVICRGRVAFMAG